MRTLPRQLIKWIRSFHDLNSDALQTKLRAELASFKLPGEITRDRLLKTLLDMLSVWCKIAGNVKSNHVSLMSYYATVRDKMIAAQTAEQLLKFQTPQVSRREENPALVTITPRSGSGAATPVPNTSLNLLRASAAAESGGGNGTEDAEDNEPRSSTSRARSSTRDAQKSEMELLMEGDALRAAGFARIAKTTRVKAEKALKGGGIVNLAKTTLLRIKYGILLLIKFLSIGSVPCNSVSELSSPTTWFGPISSPNCARYSRNSTRTHSLPVSPCATHC